jgi:hypothetical protein
MRGMQQAELRRRLSYQSRVVTAPGVAIADPAGDDWLSDIGDVDWVDTFEQLPARPASANDARVIPRADGWPAPGDPRAAVVQRRRLLAVLALVVVVGLAIAVPLLVFRGGGANQAQQTVPSTSTTPPATRTTPATPTPTTTTPLTVKLPASGTLRIGVDSPAEVAGLQKALAKLGFTPGPADGVFGTSTQGAVVAFQRSKGLGDDGIVGAKTASALNAALAAQAG